MSEKKRGFFSRLFGGSSEETKDEQEQKAPESAELRESLESLQSAPLDPVEALKKQLNSLQMKLLIWRIQRSPQRPKRKLLTSLII